MLALSMALAAAPVEAARLQGATGNVVVNRGQGFVPVKGDSEVFAGDQIVVGAGGQAVLAYGDGCDVPVEVGKVTEVGPKPPCQLGRQITTQAVNDPAPAPAPADGGAFGGIFEGPGLIIAAGVAVAVGVGVAIAVNSGGSSSASP